MSETGVGIHPIVCVQIKLANSNWVLLSDIVLVTSQGPFVQLWRQLCVMCPAELLRVRTLQGLLSTAALLHNLLTSQPPQSQVHMHLQSNFKEVVRSCRAEMQRAAKMSHS